MSETSILPGAAPVADGGTAVPMPPEFDSGEGGDRRRLMILGAVVAVVVVAIAAFLLLHKGSSNSTTSGAVPHGTPKALPSAPAGNHGKSAGHGKAAAKGHHHGGAATLPKRTNRVVVRDPFKPLVVAPAANSSQQGATTTVSPPPAAPVTAPTTAPVVIPPTQPTTSTTTPAGRPIWIRLVSTNGDRSATFDVGYPHHKFHRFKVLAPSAGSTQGTVFDKMFALLGIQNGQVTVQVGDSTPFDLTKGVARPV